MAPTRVYKPPITHTVRIAVELGSWPATRPGVLRMPMPSVLPTMTARPKPTPRMRIRPRDGEEVAVWFNIRPALLGLERDQHHVDCAANLARGVARSERFEFDIAGLPAIHHRLAVGGVLDLAARQVDD